MVKKLDVMRARDGEDAWDIVDGKVTRVKKKEEIKVEGPIVKEAIKEVKIVKKEIPEKKKEGGF